MKRRLLKSAYNNLSAAIDVLEDVKEEDLRHRIRAKASQKPKWTTSIHLETELIDALKKARLVIRVIPRRV